MAYTVHGRQRLIGADASASKHYVADTAAELVSGMTPAPRAGDTGYALDDAAGLYVYSGSAWAEVTGTGGGVGSGLESYRNTGRYLGCDGGYNGGSSANQTFSANNTIYYHPFWVPGGVTIDLLGLYCVTAAGSAKLRLALYAASDGLPAGLLAESGEITTVNATLHSFNPSYAIPAGGALLYKAAQTDVGAAGSSYKGCASTVLHNFSQLLGSSTGNLQAFHVSEARAFGAFPATATPVVVESAVNWPMPLIRVG